MPIYDFKCTAEKCGHEFESLIIPREPVQCPKCRTIKVDRLPSVFGTYKIRGNNSASQTPKRFSGK